jgi:hypothetical protein
VVVCGVLLQVLASWCGLSASAVDAVVDSGAAIDRAVRSKL